MANVVSQKESAVEFGDLVWVEGNPGLCAYARGNTIHWDSSLHDTVKDAPGGLHSLDRFMGKSNSFPVSCNQGDLLRSEIDPSDTDLLHGRYSILCSETEERCQLRSGR
jgi:hypothetical protein